MPGGRLWTDDDQEHLRLRWSAATVGRLAVELGRSKSSVSTQALRMGLPRKGTGTNQQVKMGEIAAARLHLSPLSPEDEAALAERPRTRGDCAGGLRPCPWVGCRYHLAIEVSRKGSLRLSHDRPPWEIEETCALDVAERLGGSGMGDTEQALQQIGDALGLTRERVRQLVAEAAEHFRRAAVAHLVVDAFGGER